MVHKLGMHHSWRCMLLGGANLPQRSLLLSLFFAQHAQFARPGIEFRGSSLVSFLKPWAHQHAGKGRIGG